MPTFDTPEPISVSLELGVGDIRIAASDRSDTVVEVRPSDPANKGDVSAAEQTRVEYADGRLVVKAPKGWRQYSPRGGGESIDVEIALPAGSRLDGEAGVAAAALHAAASASSATRRGSARSTSTRRGPCRSAPAPATSASSGPSAGPRSRPAPARFRSAASTGRQWSRTRTATPGSATLRATSARTPRTARSPSTGRGRRSSRRRRTATSSSAQSRSGEVVAETGFGQVDIGVVDGVAAWLELKTSFGRVQQRPRGRRRPRSRARTRSRSAPAPATATSRSAAPPAPRTRGTRS